MTETRGVGPAFAPRMTGERRNVLAMEHSRYIQTPQTAASSAAPR